MSTTTRRQFLANTAAGAVLLSPTLTLANDAKPVETFTITEGDLKVMLRDNSQSPKVLSGVDSLFNRKDAPDFDAFDPDKEANERRLVPFGKVIATEFVNLILLVMFVRLLLRTRFRRSSAIQADNQEQTGESEVHVIHSVVSVIGSKWTAIDCPSQALDRSHRVRSHRGELEHEWVWEASGFNALRVGLVVVQLHLAAERCLARSFCWKRHNAGCWIGCWCEEGDRDREGEEVSYDGEEESHIFGMSRTAS